MNSTPFPILKSGRRFPGVLTPLPIESCEIILDPSERIFPGGCFSRFQILRFTRMKSSGVCVDRAFSL